MINLSQFLEMLFHLVYDQVGLVDVSRNFILFFSIIGGGNWLCLRYNMYCLMFVVHHICANVYGCS